jgi:hypothetical protein
MGEIHVNTRLYLNNQRMEIERKQGKKEIRYESKHIFKNERRKLEGKKEENK